MPFAARRGRGAGRRVAGASFYLPGPGDRRVQRAGRSSTGWSSPPTTPATRGRVFAVDPATGETVGTTALGRRAAATSRRSRPAAAARCGSATSATTRRPATRSQVPRVPVGRGDRDVDARVLRRSSTPTARTTPRRCWRDPRDRPALRRHQGGLRRHDVRRARASSSADGPNRLRPVGDVLPHRHRRGVLPRRAALVRAQLRATPRSTRSPSLSGSARSTLPAQEQGEGIAVDGRTRLLLSSEGAHSDVLRVTLPADVARRWRRPPPRRRPSDPPSASPSTASREDSELPETTETAAVGVAVAPAGLVGLGDHPGARCGRCGDVEPADWLPSAMPRLRRTSPDQPGWTRRRAGKGFVYLDERGERLPDEDAQRVRDLVIPPAWDGRLGHAVRERPPAGGRHRRRRPAAVPLPPATGGPGGTRRSSTGCCVFGKALAKARELVLVDLGREGMPLERACAAAVRLLDLGYFRIGNDVYADDERHASGSPPSSAGTCAGTRTGWSSRSSASPASSTRSRSTTPW